jgi:tRNA (adenine22-N1)-methyltransferase
MRLSERMEAILRLMPEGHTVADVGCDHGFVSMELVLREIGPKVIAMDLREGPLSRARDHIAMRDLEGKVETRLSDGFAALTPGEADACIIAGMGGRVMQKILTEGRDCAMQMSALVLQPQSEIPEFRAFLRENGFRIRKNDVVFDEGKWYFPMLVTPGEEETLSPEEQELADRFGADLLKPGSPLRPYLEWQRDKLGSILADIRQKGVRDEARLTDLETDLAWTQKALDRVNA